MREKLPETRSGATLHFTIMAAGQREEGQEHPSSPIEVDGYVIANTYEDGRLAEFFIRVSKCSEAMGPSLDMWAVACSMALQFGAPVDQLLRKFVGTRMEPAGPVTGVPGVKKCTSPHDLISRWLLQKFATPQLLAKYYPTENEVQQSIKVTQ